MRIVEGIESTWHYHLAPDGKPFTSLCGRRTMQTSIPLSRWGMTPKGYHIPEKWCAECKRLAALRCTACDGEGEALLFTGNAPCPECNCERARLAVDIDSPQYRVLKFVSARQVIRPNAPEVIAAIAGIELRASDLLALVQRIAAETHTGDSSRG